MATTTNQPKPTSPEAAPRQSPARERRRATRLPTATPGTLAGRSIQVFNVSLEGVGFRSKTPFDVGSAHPISIGPGPLQLQAQVKIVCTRLRGDGLHELGAVFL